MAGYSSEGALPNYPSHGGLRPNIPPPQVAHAFNQISTNPSELNSQTSNQTNVLLAKDRFPDGITLPPVATAPSMITSRPSTKTTIPLRGIWHRTRFVRW
jgi:hypothetical protein